MPLSTSMQVWCHILYIDDMVRWGVIMSPKMLNINKHYNIAVIVYQGQVCHMESSLPWASNKVCHWINWVIEQVPW